MAAYNAEAYLRAAMDSILNQTLADLELIVVNDGSTDSTADILTEYAERDARVTIIHQDNAGSAAARNAAIARCCGDFIAIMDGDDIAHPGRLEQQVVFLTQNPEYAAVSCRCELIDESGAHIKTQRVRPAAQEAGVPLEELLRLPPGPILVNQTAMIRISSLDDTGATYRPWFRGFLEDFDLSLRVAEKHRIAHLNAPPLCQYRQYPEGSANNMSQNQVLFWHYWCAAVLSAHCRRQGVADPIDHATAADSPPCDLLPALKTLPHPIKAACMKSARHWCRRSLRNGMSHAAEQIIDGLTTLATNKHDRRILKKVLRGVLFYALRAGQWRYAMKVAHQLAAPLKQ